MPPGRPLPPLLEVADRADLREWLEANHSTSRGVLLAVGKKGHSVTALTLDDAVEEGLCFGWIDGTARRLDDERYTVLFTPRRPRSTWARSNRTRVARLTDTGLMTPAGLAAVERAKADGSWEALDVLEALDVPADLAQALVEAGGRATFDELNDSTRRMALFWIATAKRPETRARRIAATAKAAREGHGPL